MLDIIKRGIRFLFEHAKGTVIFGTAGAAGGGAILAARNPEETGELIANITGGVKDGIEKGTEERDKKKGKNEKESGALGAIQDFFKDNFTFGAGSLVGAGLLAAAGLYLKDPMLVAGLAAVGLVAGQPLMNAIMPPEKTGPKPTPSGASPKIEPHTPARTEETVVEVPAQIPPKPPVEKVR